MLSSLPDLQIQAERRPLNPRPVRRTSDLEHHPVGDTAALLRRATKHYERHVLAWYALGRPGDASVARETIARYRRQLSAEGSDSRTTGERTDT
jgi:hypothetical protein